MVYVVLTWADEDGIHDLARPMDRLPVAGDEVMLDGNLYIVNAVRFCLCADSPPHEPVGTFVHLVRPVWLERNPVEDLAFQHPLSWAAKDSN